MKNIGLYFGSFDPVHNFHTAIVEKCLGMKLVDEVWVIPTYNHVDKSYSTSPFVRYDMCIINFANMKNVYIIDREIVNKHDGKTYITVNNIINEDHLKNPNRHDLNHFYIIIGEDCAKQIPDHWYRGKDLINEFKFIVFKRKDNDIPLDNPWYAKHKVIDYIDDLQSKISSSFIRNCFKEGKLDAAKLCINNHIFNYIVMNQLYFS